MSRTRLVSRHRQPVASFACVDRHDLKKNKGSRAANEHIGNVERQLKFKVADDDGSPLLVVSSLAAKIWEN